MALVPERYGVGNRQPTRETGAEARAGRPSMPRVRRRGRREPRPGLLMVAEHNRSIDAVSLGEDDLENPWSGGRAEATIRVREEVADRSHARDIVKSRDERQPGSAEREVLAGLVERVTFHNPDSGFCVLRVKARGHRDLVTVVGHAAMVAAGEWITASGEWVNDRTHGQQFKARFLRSSAPSSIEGIEKYLGSGMIRGIGPVYARRGSLPDAEDARRLLLRGAAGVGPRRGPAGLRLQLHSPHLSTCLYFRGSWRKPPVTGPCSKSCWAFSRASTEITQGAPLQA